MLDVVVAELVLSAIDAAAVPDVAPPGAGVVGIAVVDVGVVVVVVGAGVVSTGEENKSNAFSSTSRHGRMAYHIEISILIHLSYIWLYCKSRDSPGTSDVIS